MTTKAMGVVVLAILLCTATVQGFPMFKRARCLCIGPGIKAVRFTDIEKAFIAYPSNSCNKVEVIITLKAHRGQRCMDPTSKQARRIRKEIEKKNPLKH